MTTKNYKHSDESKHIIGLKSKEMWKNKECRDKLVKSIRGEEE